MQQDEYLTITRGRGATLRDLAHSMIRDARDLPGRRELRAELEEIYPDDEHAPIRAALEKKLVALAEAAQDRGRRFELRGKADRMVLEVEQGLADQDVLVKPEPEEVLDLDAVMDKAMGRGMADDTRGLWDDHEEVADGRGGRVLVRRRQS